MSKKPGAVQVLAFADPGLDIARHVDVARLAVKMVNSVADDEAAAEEWESLADLTYDREKECFVKPVTISRPVPVSASGRRGQRSRVLDPVLGAWERWWDSVQ